MVEHRHARFWLGKLYFPMGFSGGSLSSGPEWSLPSDHPIRGERGGVDP